MMRSMLEKFAVFLTALMLWISGGVSAHSNEVPMLAEQVASGHVLL